MMIPAKTRWLADAGAQAVCRMLADAGHEVFFVGGCVRDALLGIDADDIDLSTDAHPDQVMALANAVGMTPIPTGIDHGTVTVVANGTGYEVTTYRRDVATDGRRAVVAFSETMTEDAMRRDFTMNALYAGPDGRVLDPVGGIADLKARRIRFIGHAPDRIREDYLRTLRFFRFHAWYGDPAAGPDTDALNAIARHLDGLTQLSAERVGAEMRKLFNAPDPAPSVAMMRQTGVLQVILPGADDRWLAPLVHIETLLGQGPDAICRLVALGGDNVAQRLRFSRAEARRYTLLRDVAYTGSDLSETAYRHGAGAAIHALMLRTVMGKNPVDPRMLEPILVGAAAQFPIKPADLMPDVSGPALGAALRVLEERWIASGFSLTREELLR